MNGRYIVGVIVLTALIVGAAVYYLQVYAFYDPIDPASPAAEIRLQPLTGDPPEPMLTTAFDGIDSASSPLRFRACFLTPMTLPMLTEGYRIHDRPTPLIAPRWFSCFDAGRIGADLETGAAVAFLSQANIHPGVDRVVAVYPDGRAYAWQQLNDSADD